MSPPQAGAFKAVVYMGALGPYKAHSMAVYGIHAHTSVNSHSDGRFAWGSVPMFTWEATLCPLRC